MFCGLSFCARASRDRTLLQKGGRLIKAIITECAQLTSEGIRARTPRVPATSNQLRYARGRL